MPRRRRPRAPIPEIPADGQVAAHPIFRGRRPGRPNLMTDEMLVKFLTYIRAGNYRSVAAASCGLSYDSVRAWYLRGKGRDASGRPPRPEDIRFARMVDEAEAQAEALVTGNIVARSRQDTAAGLAWLRTRHPDRWPRDPGDAPPEPALPPLLTGGTGGTTHIERDRLIIVDRETLHQIAVEQVRSMRDERPEPLALETEEESDGAGIARHSALDTLRVEG